MRMLGSVVMAEADTARVPAGGALAVDRELFSKGVQDHPGSVPAHEKRKYKLKHRDLGLKHGDRKVGCFPTPNIC